MKFGRQSLVRLPRCAALVAIVLFSGCISGSKRVDNSASSSDFALDPGEVYTLANPDVVEVIFTNRSDQRQIARIEADGCIHLSKMAPVHVEGDTCAEAAADIAEQARVPAESVRVQVAEYDSRKLFLFGQVNGGPRVVEFHGPETVIDVLSRTGGLSPSAASNEIYIVRAQMMEGLPAQVLTVDLDAIRRHDGRTNYRVQPLDEIYVGEMPRSRIGKALPTILKPLYESFVQMLPYREPQSPPDQSIAAK